MLSPKGPSFDIIEFASKVAKFIEQNFKATMALFAAILIAATAWTIKKNMDEKAQKQAFTELYRVTKIVNEKQEGFAKAEEAKENKNKEPKDPSAEAKAEETLTAATGDLDKDYGSTVNDLKAFIEKYPNRNATAEAALTLSEIYSEYGMEAEGAQVLEKVLGGWTAKNILQQVMAMRAGDLWASLSQCEKANPHWQKIADSEAFFKDQAQLKLGVCLQQLGRLDEAKIWFEKIRDANPNSAEGFNAKRYLRYIEFKSKSFKGGEQPPSGKAQQSEKDSDTPS